MRMKKIRLLSILSLCVVAITSCNQTPKEDPKPSSIDKVSLKYNYHDVKSNYVNLNRALPSIGSPKLLILPIYFSDSSNFVTNKQNVLDDIRTAFFGTSEETGYESVSSYYSKLSNNRCTLTGTVSNWIDVSESYENYKTIDSEKNLLSSVVDEYFSTSDDIRSSYDLDKDGYLDSVVMIYAAPTYEALQESYNNLWFYTNWIDDAISDKDTPAPSTYLWGSYTAIYGAEKALLRAGTSYAGGNTNNCELDAHTFIHETGHLFGLPDYYDYSGTALPAGGFSMQDLNVGSHDPFSAMALGWVDPYIPDKECEIELKPFQSSHEVILLSNSFNSDVSPFDEYFLLELYTGDNLNKFDIDNKYSSISPQGSRDTGIRLWHIDARLMYTSDRTIRPLNITTNPLIPGNKVIEMMSNSYGGTHASVLGSNYYNYNILQLIRNNTLIDYQPTSSFSGSDLFKDGSYFSLDAYKKQFVKSSLNNGEKMKWAFSVSMNNETAKISIINVA